MNVFPRETIICLPPHEIARRRPMTDLEFLMLVLEYNERLKLQGMTVRRVRDATPVTGHVVMTMRATALLWYDLATSRDERDPAAIVTQVYKQHFCGAFDRYTGTICTHRGRPVDAGYVLCDSHASDCAVTSVPPAREGRLVLRAVVDGFRG
jgi:hypothetical protein